MDKITYFDVEYANAKNKSICQIGILCERFESRDPVYPELDLYINPEDGFDDKCVAIHGITSEKVSASPNFQAAWKQIEPYFTNSIIVGHNVANSDLSAIVKCLRRYNIDIPEFYYVCTLQIARDFVPAYAVQSYGISDLCSYFDIDVGSAHNAFDDACATADLFHSLVKNYRIDYLSYVQKYSPRETDEFSPFISNPALRKSIAEFYGTVRGFSIDGKITEEELAYILDWRNEYANFSDRPEIAGILRVIDKISDDRKITMSEAQLLQQTIKEYLDLVQSSAITLATQVLDGIMKGILVDGVVSEAECRNLRQWLYDNIYLSGHYPFNRLIETLDGVLEDSVITREERASITNTIHELLDPVNALRHMVYSLDGKHVCLSGNFSMGQKSEVEKRVVSMGGIIDSNVKKSTNYLIVGDCDCASYSNGTYGTKVKKAMEYNEKGCNIQIVKESDVFS